jgi:hypothetical protein
MHGANAPGAAASFAGIFDDRALALALAAGARDAKKALLETHLTATAAGRTTLRCGACLGAVAAAGFASTMAGNFDFLLDARHRLLKLQRHIIAQIFATATAATPALAATEELAENVAEDIFESAARKVETAREWAAVAECCVTKLIILGPFL